MGKISERGLEHKPLTILQAWEARVPSVIRENMFPIVLIFLDNRVTGQLSNRRMQIVKYRGST